MKQFLLKIIPEIIKIRHEIHAKPELGNEEINTSALVVKTLKEFGYEDVFNIATTGVTTLLDSGKPGKTVALRADMDALPIQEETGLPYCSKIEGVMHACGHDGHTATLLAVAGALIKRKDLFKGKIKFIFQPAEEIGTGAFDMIKAGILENPTVDAIFGYHNTGKSALGTVEVKSDCMMAGADDFIIVVKGQGGHAAHPDNVIDPIYIGSLLVPAIKDLVNKLKSTNENLVISVTQFQGGSTFNVIPDQVELKGTLRSFTKTTQTKAKEQLTELVKSIATSYNAKATIKFENSFPPVNNANCETELVITTAKEIVGINNVIEMTTPTMGAEDFCLYLEKVPGCFFFIGSGGTEPIHSPKYQFNDELLPIAAQMMAQVAINFLNINR